METVQKAKLRANLPYAVAPTFESVWAMMQENAEAMKEFRESQKETERIIKES